MAKGCYHSVVDTTASARGCFVTLEGGEGSGKTLQLDRLADEFERRGVALVTTCEPGGTAFGLEVRQVLLSTAGARREPEAELLLYLADRFQHLKERIEPTLAAGTTVLCDRYHDATLVYQGLARGLGLDWIDRLAGPLKLLAPDLTLVLDLEVAQALGRARARNDAAEDTLGRFESEEFSFHERVRAGYYELAERYPQRVRLVDAGGAAESVTPRLIEVLESRGILPRPAPAGERP